VDGKRLYESNAICRYLGRKFGTFTFIRVKTNIITFLFELDFAGKDEWEQAKVDEIADFHTGVHEEIRLYFQVFAGYKEGDKVAIVQFNYLLLQSNE
jgi:glutathione S-transferase